MSHKFWFVVIVSVLILTQLACLPGGGGGGDSDPCKDAKYVVENADGSKKCVRDGAVVTVEAPPPAPAPEPTRQKTVGDVVKEKAIETITGEKQDAAKIDFGTCMITGDCPPTK